MIHIRIELVSDRQKQTKIGKQNYFKLGSRFPEKNEQLDISLKVLFRFFKYL